MKKILLITLLCLSMGILNWQENVYKSNKYGFSINFPDTVEFEEFDSKSGIFTSSELIGEYFIMYKVQALYERPNAPLPQTKEECDRNKKMDNFQSNCRRVGEYSKLIPLGKLKSFLF